MLKGFKIRLLPTKEQETSMWKHINGSRYTFNWALALRKKMYEETGKTLNWIELSRQLTQFKKTPEGGFLKETNCQALIHSLKDLENAYTCFFRKKIGFPKFKSIHTAKKTFYIAGNTTYFKTGDRMILPTIGSIRYKTNYNLPTGRKAFKMLNPRVTLHNGKWFLTFSYDAPSTEKPKLNDFCAGIDLGIKTLMTVAYDGKVITIANPNKQFGMKKHDRQLKRIQRRLARAKKGSNRRNKTKLRLGKKCDKIRNTRRDFMHKATHQIVSLLPRKITVEDLNVKGMVQNRHLAKAIQQCNFAEIRRQLKYKAEEKGIEFVVADRFFPSSKTCSCCGSYTKDLKLSDRVFTCVSCKSTMDRDLNAAINLEHYVPTKGLLALK